MDGTVYAEHPVYDDQCWRIFDQFLADKLGLSLPEATALAKKWQNDYGDGRLAMQEEVGLCPQEWDHYWGAQGNPSILPVIPGLWESLALLPGHRMIFTDSDTTIAEKLLTHLQIREAFHEISTYTNRGGSTAHKGNGATYASLAQSLPVAPEKCVFFENSIRNLAHGKKVGWTTVLLHGEKSEPFIDAAYPNLMEALEDILSEVDNDATHPKG